MFFSILLTFSRRLFFISKITINHDICEGEDCKDCVDLCPMEVLIFDGDKIKAQNPEDCTLCETCADLCPNECISVED